MRSETSAPGVKKDLWKNFTHAVIATDIVIFTIKDDDLKVLMIKMKKDPFKNLWAVPGGLVKVDESVDSSAKNHLRNKTGVGNVYLEQLYTFGGVDRDPLGRVVSVAYFALVPGDNLQLKTTADYEDVDWFSVEDLPGLAYDHKKVIKVAIERLRAKLEYTNIVYSLLPREFTLTEMQKIYETILKREIDKRNFRKKILSLGIIKKTENKTSGGASRPAYLYKFKSRKPEVIEII